MPPKKKSGNGLLVNFVLGLIAIGLLTGLGITAYMWYEGLGPFASETPAPEPGQVAWYVNVDYKLTKDDVGSGSVYVYDADNNMIGKASISSGQADFSGAGFREGDVVYIQARPADTSSSSYIFYTTPLIEVTIPAGSGISNTAYTSIEVWKVATNVVTLSATDQDSNSISSSSLDTTDKSIKVDISFNSAESAAAYGVPEAYTDMYNGKSYTAGFWYLFRFNATQPSLKGWDASFSTLDYVYYAINMDFVYVNTDGDVVGTTKATLSLTDDSSTDWIASSLYIDVFDVCLLSAGKTAPDNVASFLNGDTDLNPTAISTTIA